MCTEVAILCYPVNIFLMYIVTGGGDELGR